MWGIILLRQQKERDFQTMEKRFRLLLDSVHEGVLLVDAEGCLRQANEFACRTLGYTERDWSGKKLHHLVFHTDNQEGPQQENDGIIARTLRNRTEFHEPKALGWRKDGSSFHMELSCIPEIAGGKLLGAVLCFQDISEKEKLEISKQKSQDKLIIWAGEMKLRIREAELMSDMMDLLHACVHLREAYDILSRYVRLLFPGKFGALFITDLNHETMETGVSWGNAPISEESLTTRDCWALRRGQLHSYVDPQRDMVCRHVREGEKPPAYICIPLMEQGEALGVLHLQCSPNDKVFYEDLPEEFREGPYQLAINMAERIGLALANMKLRERLRYQAIRDPLTGLYNRRHMEESLLRELARAVRKKSCLGVVLIDIDYFKKYNDSYGHDAGDALLRSMGNFLQNKIRKEDIACRYGGEEFLLVLVDSRLQDSVRRADHIRREVKEMKVDWVVRDTVSISCGVACFPDHAGDIASLIKAADQALYRAKSCGRDQVRAAGEDAASGENPA